MTSFTTTEETQQSVLVCVYVQVQILYKDELLKETSILIYENTVLNMGQSLLVIKKAGTNA